MANNGFTSSDDRWWWCEDHETAEKNPPGINGGIESEGHRWVGPYSSELSALAHHRGATERSVVGIVRHRKREGGRSPCVCCEGGQHVFSYYVEIDPDLVDRRYCTDMNGRPTNVLDSSTFVYDGIRRVPEGRRVRITIEPG